MLMTYEYIYMYCCMNYATILYMHVAALPLSLPPSLPPSLANTGFKSFVALTLFASGAKCYSYMLKW